MYSEAEIAPCIKCKADVLMTPARKRHSRRICSKCSGEIVKRWVAENKERAAESSRKRTRKWQLNNQDKLPTAADKKAYDRQYNFRKKYGMTVEDFDALLLRQNGACAICLNIPKSQKSFHVDHDHATGKVRGILCQPCNMALGIFQDNTDRLAKAISYLQEVR